MHSSLKMDEREQQVTGRAAWYGFCASTLLFFALAFGYNITGHILPWTTQLIVLVLCAITFVTTVRNNGYHFRLPGILPENDVTLGQPAAIRSIPWTMFVLWAAGTIVDGIPYAVQGVKQGQISLGGSILYTVASVTIGFIITKALARDVRLGRGTVIRALNALNLLNIFGLVALVVLFLKVPDATGLNGFHGLFGPGSAFLPFSLLWSLWYEFALIRYRKVMEADSSWDPKKSFWTAEHWAAKNAAFYLLVTSSVAYLVFNGLSLLQQFAGVSAANLWVFVPSMIGAAVGGFSLTIGLFMNLWQNWKKPATLLKLLLWAVVIIGVNVLVAHYTPNANSITF